MASSAHLRVLREALGFLPTEISAVTHRELPAACAARGLPMPPPADGHTKFERATASFKEVPDTELPRVAAAVLAAGIADATVRNQVQDALWALEAHPAVPERTRRSIASAVDAVNVFQEVNRLVDLLDRLWVLDTDPLGTAFGFTRSLRQEVEQHLVRNDDWGGRELFERLGAFDASDRRFALFLEGLASADNVPDEDIQRQIVAAVQPHLEQVGLEMRETGDKGGYPVFTLVSIRVSRGRPKNLLFASTGKPDLRFSDALDNDIEIVGDRDIVLAYDRPIGAGGLRWCDLQAWWKDERGLDSDDEAKRTLYSRLVASLPEDSPDYDGPHPQRTFFHLYHAIFKASIPDLPALLPEVWVHWDPQTVRLRGKDALFRFRMDFLLLLPNHSRVVVEIDGQHHYAQEGRPSPAVYAENMRADRDLKLTGYEVFRFGADELQDEHHAYPNVERFFRDLFRLYRVPMP